MAVVQNNSNGNKQFNTGISTTVKKLNKQGNYEKRKKHVIFKPNIGTVTIYSPSSSSDDIIIVGIGSVGLRAQYKCSVL